MTDKKTMTLRLTDDMSEALHIIALVDDMAVTDVIRRAIDEYIGSLGPDFHQRLRVYAAKHESAINKLMSHE